MRGRLKKALAAIFIFPELQIMIHDSGIPTIRRITVVKAASFTVSRTEFISIWQKSRFAVF